MKVGILIVSLMVVACQNYDDQINTLQDDIATLRSENTTLQSMISSLSSSISSAQSTANAAQSAAAANSTAIANAIEQVNATLAAAQADLDEALDDYADQTAETIASFEADFEATIVQLQDDVDQAVASLEEELGDLIVYTWLPAFDSDDHCPAAGTTASSTFDQTRDQVIDGVSNVEAEVVTRTVVVSFVSSSTVVTETSTEQAVDIDVNGDGDFLDAIKRTQTHWVYSAVVSGTGESLGTCTAIAADRNGAWYESTDTDPDGADAIQFTGTWISNQEDVRPESNNGITPSYTFTYVQYYQIIVNGSADSPEPVPSDETIASVVSPTLNPDYTYSAVELDVENKRILIEVTVPAQGIADFSGAFGGAVVNNGTFSFPAAAETWAGFANQNTGLYPFSFENGGEITFTASAVATDVTVSFRFERLPHPDVDPAFNTDSVTVSGQTATEYTITIPSRPAGETYSSFIMYLAERDLEVNISDVEVTAN